MTTTVEGVLETISGLDEVDRLTHYKGPMADFSAILSPEGSERGSVQAVRVAYLREYRQEWEWVEATKNEESDNHNGFILFKRRE